MTMKKRMMAFIVTIVLGLVITGCSNVKSEPIEVKLSAKKMVDQMVMEAEQSAQVQLQPDEVKETYNLNPEILDEFSIRVPMMNVSTNEIAILKVKDAKDIPEVESAVKQRAENVKKLFEYYLPDQYENAKNYKLVTKGNYVLFIISDKADELVNVYDSFFDQK